MVTQWQSCSAESWSAAGLNGQRLQFQRRHQHQEGPTRSRGKGHTMQQKRMLEEGVVDINAELTSNRYLIFIFFFQTITRYTLGAAKQYSDMVMNHHNGEDLNI